MKMMRFENEELQGQLAPEVLSTDPEAWRAPSHNEIKLLVGRESKTGLSGIEAAYICGITPQNFRKYLCEPGTASHRKMSFAMWHLLLHKIGVKAAETVTPYSAHPGHPWSKAKNSGGAE